MQLIPKRRHWAATEASETESNRLVSGISRRVSPTPAPSTKCERSQTPARHASLFSTQNCTGQKNSRNNKIYEKQVSSVIENYERKTVTQKENLGLSKHYAY